MKEFASQTGGRFTYADDILNLQELSLIMTEIFSDCGDFIVSGCEVKDGGITEGVVWLNGKLRKLSGIASVNNWPQYIYEHNYIEEVPYQSGGSKVGRNVYAAKIGAVVPVEETEITGERPQSITINQTGGRTLKDAWFGKYALLLNPSSGQQVVNGMTVMTQAATLASMTVGGRLEVNTGSNKKALLYTSGNSIILEANTSDKVLRILENLEDNSFNFTVNGTSVANITAERLYIPTMIESPKVKGGKISLSGYNIMETETASDTGKLFINMKGYGESTLYHRDFVVGDGKGKVILQMHGSGHCMHLYGNLMVVNDNHGGISYTTTARHSQGDVYNHISFSDGDGSLGSVGYNGSANLTIKDNVGNPQIIGQTSVDIFPSIREGGVKLSDRYVLRSEFQAEMGKSTLYYTKSDADSKFASKTSGLYQFITGSNTGKSLCGHIGAAVKTEVASTYTTKTEAEDTYAKKSELLADMATSYEAKKQIRENIGAAAASDYYNDTGWVAISGHPNLYARQWGDIVFIQGKIENSSAYRIANTAIFELPGNIMPPKHEVMFSLLNENGGSVAIKAGGTLTSPSFKVAAANSNSFNLYAAISYIAH